MTKSLNPYPDAAAHSCRIGRKDKVLAAYALFIAAQLSVMLTTHGAVKLAIAWVGLAVYVPTILYGAYLLGKRRPTRGRARAAVLGDLSAQDQPPDPAKGEY